MWYLCTHFFALVVVVSAAAGSGGGGDDFLSKVFAVNVCGGGCSGIGVKPSGWCDWKFCSKIWGLFFFQVFFFLKKKIIILVVSTSLFCKLKVHFDFLSMLQHSFEQLWVFFLVSCVSFFFF